MASKLNLGRIDHIVQKVHELRKHVHPDSLNKITNLIQAAEYVQIEVETNGIKFLPVDRKKVRHKL